MIGLFIGLFWHTYRSYAAPVTLTAPLPTAIARSKMVMTRSRRVRQPARACVQIFWLDVLLLLAIHVCELVSNSEPSAQAQSRPRNAESHIGFASA
jgi:hypothetical protein